MIQVICNLQPLPWWFPGAKFFVAQRTNALLATLASLKISSYVALIAGGSGIDGISKGPVCSPELGTMNRGLCNNKPISMLCVLALLLLCFQSRAHIGKLWRLDSCDKRLNADFLYPVSCSSVGWCRHIPADQDFASYVPIPI